MTSGLMNLWTRSMAITNGSPEVVMRRLGMMSPAAAWSPTAAIEVQCMLLEKLQASTESWWAMCRGALAIGSTPAWDSANLWWSPVQQDRMAQRLVGAAEQILQPVSRQVSANVERLRQS